MKQGIIETIETTVEETSQQADIASAWKTPIVRERRLFKYHGACGEYDNRCPVEALGKDHFRQHTCYDRVLENARLHERHGLADVCGKCAAIVPCSFTDPVELPPERNPHNPER